VANTPSIRCRRVLRAQPSDLPTYARRVCRGGGMSYRLGASTVGRPQASDDEVSFPVVSQGHLTAGVVHMKIAASGQG